MERPMQKPQDNKIKNQPTNIAKAEIKQEKKIEDKDKKIEEQVKKEIENNVAEAKVEEKKEEKAEIKQEVKKKDIAIVNGRDLGISKKHSMAICDLIRGKNIEEMIHELDLVSRLKKPLKMKGEIPHRKGKIMSGRYPVNACKVFIKLLKSLNANSQVNSMENVYIATAKADDASRPFKRGGSMRFKRANVLLIAKEKVKKENKEKKK